MNSSVKMANLGHAPALDKTICWIFGANLLMLPMCTMLPQEQLQGPGMAVVLWQNTGLALTPHPKKGTNRCHGSW
jgi:hypothetical protein